MRPICLSFLLWRFAPILGRCRPQSLMNLLYMYTRIHASDRGCKSIGWPNDARHRTTPRYTFLSSIIERERIRKYLLLLLLFSNFFFTIFSCFKTKNNLHFPSVASHHQKEGPLHLFLSKPPTLHRLFLGRESRNYSGSLQKERDSVPLQSTLIISSFLISLPS